MPFTNVDVRPVIVPYGLGFRLPELNLRTYVTHDGTDGVYYFFIDADRVLGVLGARLFHHLPYFYASIDLEADGDQVCFESTRRHPGAQPARFSGAYGPTGDRLSVEDGSLAAFLVERYRYFTEAPSGAIRYAAIDHEPWALYEVDVNIRENSLFRANGFAEPASDSVHLYSPGVDTIASPNRRA